MTVHRLDGKATIAKVSGLSFADAARAILRAGYVDAYVAGKKATKAPPAPVVAPAAAIPAVAPPDPADAEEAQDAIEDRLDDLDLDGLDPEDAALYGDALDGDAFYGDALDGDGEEAVNDASDGLDDRLLGLGALLLGGAVSAAMLDAWMTGYAAMLNPLFEIGFNDGVAQLGEIEQVTWRSEDDPATCEDCKMLDGMTWVGPEIDEAMPHPGDSDFGGRTQCGPNCRCSLDYEYVPADQATYSGGGYGDSVGALSTADLLKLWADLVK